MNSKLLSRSAWIVSFVAAAAILGFVAGIVGEHRASAGEETFPSDLLPYTYTSLSCTTPIDPINIVFTNHAFPIQIATEAGNHGGWTYNQGSTQAFGDKNGCDYMDRQSASNPNFPPQSRFHARYMNHTTSIGAVRKFGDYGSLSSADAHHEDLVACGHAVDDNSESFTFPWGTVNGGFNRGREDIRKNWVQNSDHVLEVTLMWDNTMMMEQCDPLGGEDPNIAWSDGKVYYVRTFHPNDDFDSDGCNNGMELQTNLNSETTGGRRNPANRWDFYDVAISGGIQGQDRQVDLFNDVVSVIDHYAPTGLPPSYNIWYDRGPTQGPNSWNMTAPDGKIDLFNDIVGVIGQFGHDCR